jgi:4,5:9,10-diseco-3-hydroxy-5,9,17-trioxoandrosta-1(10),2-diene-4-oate hydrolase
MSYSLIEGADIKYSNVDGISIRYASQGKGPELLLLHGFGEFLEAWWSNIDSLSEYYTVYALDLPGHGLSQEPHVRYTVDFSTRFVVSFMEAVGIKHASLIGHSVCGLLSLNLAINFPEKVDNLVLVSSIGLTKKEAPLLHRLAMLLGNFAIEPSKENILKGINSTFYNPEIVSEQLVDKACQYLAMPKTKDALLNTLRSNVTTNGISSNLILADKLHLVKCPTLIIHGAQDKVIPAEYVQNASNVMPKVKVKVLQECAHHSHIEKASEFNKIVTTFLNSNELLC